ncbi:hypothetical protein Vadar_007145 [Vaccinium darrowii]|uniref:Uncharacterized protein n=1 Tax=Vaccinium darrowii TaxID=229202 RepID=A0ACB7YL27_9ERIC|nr:hypothetical protein Vadar_007145 [Vaccinium darrowii]
MPLRLVGSPHRAFIFSETLSTRFLLLLFPLRFSTSAMSNRPNFQGGRRGGGPNSGRGGGGARRGGGRGGGGGGGRGERRWWDPVWRAERLRQQAAEMEVLDENEWWGKMEQFKRGGEQELIIKRNYSRGDQQILSDMAYQLGVYFHAYNKGKALVVSKVPLPNYHADLDDRHGSTQKEIRMSTETEKRVGNLLGSSKGEVPIDNSPNASSQSSKQSVPGVDISKPVPVLVTDASKERVSLELKERQEKMKTCDSVKALQSFREKLPAFKVRSKFLKAVAENQVEFYKLLVLFNAGIPCAALHLPINQEKFTDGPEARSTVYMGNYVETLPKKVRLLSSLTVCPGNFVRFGKMYSTKSSGMKQLVGEEEKYEGVRRRASDKYAAELRESLGVFKTAKEATKAVQKAKAERVKQRRKEADSI